MSTKTITAIVGDLSLDMQEGVTLTAHTNFGLARAWARHALGDRWDGPTRAGKSQNAADALRELRQTDQENQ